MITASHVGFIAISCTPQSIDLTVDGCAYTDMQFYRDLKKSGKQLDVMAAGALKAEGQGKTREFPVPRFAT